MIDQDVKWYGEGEGKNPSFMTAMPSLAVVDDGAVTLRKEGRERGRKGGRIFYRDDAMNGD